MRVTRNGFGSGGLQRAVSFGAPRQASSGTKGANSGLFLGVRQSFSVRRVCYG